MIGIINLISVYIPVLANDLFRYWVMIYFSFYKEIMLCTISRFESWGLMFKQETAPKTEIRIPFFFYQAKNNNYNYLNNQTGSRRKGPNGHLATATYETKKILLSQ